MANGRLEVVRFDASLSPVTGLYSFRVTMSDAAGNESSMPVDDLALLDYFTFQRAVLRGLGMVFRLFGCEGATAEIANERWRSETVRLIHYPGPSVEHAAPLN